MFIGLDECGKVTFGFSTKKGFFMSMLEGFIAAIKGPKKLSLNHWRYRLLHWFANVEVTHADQSELPRCLYTHYCPLFHLTNLMVFFAPFLFVFRLLIQLFIIIAPYIGAGLYVVSKIVEAIIATLKLPERAKVAAPVEPEVVDEELLELMRRREINSIPRLMLKLGSDRDFDDFWYKFSSKFKVLKCGDAAIHWTKFREEILAAQEKSKERRKKLNEQLVFWVGFSKAFIQALMWVAYGALGLGVVYVTLFWIVPFVAWLAYIMLTVDWLFVSWVLLKVFIGAGMLIGAIYLLFRSMKSERVRKYVAPPVSIVAEVSGAVFVSVMKVIGGTIDFVHMFYENNCPPITIVEDAEATIASVEDV